MSSRKPLSIEEKRQRTLDFLTTTADFFHLKELEKLLPKQKGIDVVQSLVEDRLRIMLKEKLSAELVANEKTIANNLAIIEASKANLDESNDRTVDLQRLVQLEERVKQQQTDLAKYAESDPEVYAELVRQEATLKASINTWVDNIFILQKYCSDRFNVARTDFFEQFGIPEDLDYVS